MSKASIAIIAFALVFSACGGDDSTPTLATETTESLDDQGEVAASFIVRESDDGAVLRLAVGDEVLTRLAPGSEPWVIGQAPDPNVLAGGDSMVFLPSDETTGTGFVEFSFTAVAAGSTVVTISRGEQTGATEALTFTVEVTD